MITAANPVVIDFDALACDELVQNFYAGGTGSKGSGPGPDYGVTFTATVRVRTDDSLPALCPTPGTSGFQNQFERNMPSGPNGAWLSGTICRR